MKAKTNLALTQTKMADENKNTEEKVVLSDEKIHNKKGNKREFESNVTGEKWFKHTSKPWKKVINQFGVILEDEIHDDKKGKKLLKKGTRVLIDDIRGRIKPQYMVTDPQGKIWFVSALNIEIEQDSERDAELNKYQYRGGVRQDYRHDGEKLNARYSVEKTTEEEYQETREILKELKKRMAEGTEKFVNK